MYRTALSSECFIDTRRKGLRLAKSRLWRLLACTAPAGASRLRCRPGMDGNQGVLPVQPGRSNSPPDCCILDFRVPSGKKIRERAEVISLCKRENVFSFRPHPYRIRPETEGLSHGLRRRQGCTAAFPFRGTSASKPCSSSPHKALALRGPLVSGLNVTLPLVEPPFRANASSIRAGRDSFALPSGNGRQRRCPARPAGQEQQSTGLLHFRLSSPFRQKNMG